MKRRPRKGMTKLDVQPDRALTDTMTTSNQTQLSWREYRRRRRLLSPVTYHTNEFGHHYAKVPVIVASLEGDACPLLREIVTEDLGCGEIMEVSGLGDTWWSFTYKGTEFTCMLLAVTCEGGSELYPASCTQSTAAERELLGELVHEITRHAIRRTA